MTVAAQPTPEHFFDTAFAFQKTAALKAAVELELFTAIDEGARTVPAIAARCRASERGVRVLCDYMTVIGFLEKRGQAYALTPDSGAFLSKRSPSYLASAVFFLAMPEFTHPFERLAEIVRRGTLPKQESTVSENNPVWVAFARAMAPMMFGEAQMVADVLEIDDRRPCRVLDIAAGHGMFGIVLAQRHPKVEITAVDWGGVLEVASENASKMGVGHRMRLLRGDAFAVDYGTGYDVALIANFLHHFDRPTNVAFLRRVAAALDTGGRAAILEFVPNDDRVSPPIAAAFALTMLGSTPSGTNYTFGELESMAVEAGFRRATAHPVPPETVVIATK